MRDRETALLDINYILITFGSHTPEAIVITLLLVQKMYFVVENFTVREK